MFFKSVSLENYLPFTHLGNKKVTINFVDKVCAFLGTNGCGKSSLLRALTPYSPVRTDYGPNGKITKVIEHDGHIFELVSDFKNAAAPHSFKKDDIELNVSGTSEVQKDLVEEHFRISPLIDKLMLGELQLCQTSKAERRAIFSSLYPGDLSFVIEYHKKVCSQIRACSNQLKLLRSREATLRSSILDESEHIKLTRFKDGATDLIDRIGKAEILIENQITTITGAVDHLKDDLHKSRVGWSILDVRDEILCLRDDVIDGFRSTGIRSQMRDTFDANTIAVIGNHHKETAQGIRRQIDRLTDSINEIKIDLDKYSQAKRDAQSADEKDQLEARFLVCQNELADIVSKIDSTPIVVPNSDQLEQIQIDVIPFVKQWSEDMHGIGTKLMSVPSLANLQAKYDNALNQLHVETNEDLAQIQKSIRDVQDRLTKLRSKPYPKDCVQVCPLRSAISDNVSSNEKMLNELIVKRDHALETIKKLNDFIKETGPILDMQHNLHSRLNKLIEVLRKFNLESIAFDNEEPDMCCNTHVYEILNRITRACQTTQLLLRKHSLLNEIESIRSTLRAMASSKQLKMSLEIIESSIHDREEKLNVGIDELTRLEEIYKKEENLHSKISETASKYKNLEDSVEDMYTLLNKERVDYYVDYCNGVLKELREAKHDLQHELFEVTKTLDDQKKHVDILESEILPVAKEIERKKRVYEGVADGLSPNSGLPCLYLIRFINRLLTRANEYIRSVWYYGMELMYLKEEDELDFTIKVLIKNSSIVKDISVCSKGQKAIINLALTLAIAVERGYLDQFPLKLDEVDEGMIDEHRTRLVSLLNKLVDRGIIKQMFLVNHFAIQSGMECCDNVCLSTDGILVPSHYNENAEIA